VTRLLVCGLALLAVSCGGIPVSPEAQQLVPLIKARKFGDAAADPDHLAEACAAALREMERDETVDPGDIIEVADYFFDHYPFSPRDLEFDEAIFESAAHSRHSAAIQLKGPLKSCETFDRVSTLQDMTDLVRSWGSAHDDGGRCVRKVYDLFRKLRAIGYDWPLETRLDRDPRKTRGLEDGLIQDLFKSVLSTHPDSPYVPLIALAAASFSESAERGRRLQALEEFWELKSSARWSRAYLGRIAWLGARRQAPRFVVEGFGEALAASKVDARLRDLGAAVLRYSKCMVDLESGSPKLDELREAVREVIAKGKGTPFPDLARHAFIFGLAEGGRWEEGEAWLRTRAGDFEDPFYACYAALHLAFRCGAAIPNPVTAANRTMELIRFAISLDSTGSPSVEAMYMMAQVHEGAGREDEAIKALEGALLRGRFATGKFEDETAELARSNAAQMLGRIRVRRQEWVFALDAWGEWDSSAGASTPLEEEERCDAMALSLEKLGRRREALEFHWLAAGAQPVMSRERARSLKTRFEAYGMVDDLKMNVRLRIEAIEAWGNRVKDEDGLRWLADQLGVPVK
jgi:hypothetical protein